MTRHTTVRRSEVPGVFHRDDFTVGVPLTAAQAYAISALVHAEFAARKSGGGVLAVTAEALTDGALRNIARLMDCAITDISVLRDTPQR